MGDAGNMKVFPVKPEETKSQSVGHHSENNPSSGVHMCDRVLPVDLLVHKTVPLYLRKAQVQTSTASMLTKKPEDWLWVTHTAKAYGEFSLLLRTYHRMIQRGL